MADRSDEFFALARSIPATGAMSAIRAGGGSGAATTSSQPSGDTSRRTPSQQQQNPALADLRKFRTAASEISRDVSITSSLLAELSRLVKTGAGGTRMFGDESANERADALVLRIKSSIEGLHFRLEEAESTLYYSRRRLGKNSQAGLEASNLAEQLKEDFGKTASSFKAVLEQRSDGMKETNDRKRRVIGGGGDEGRKGGRGLENHTAGGGEVGLEERMDLMTLMNKPAVYGEVGDPGGMFGNSTGGGMSGIGGLVGGTGMGGGMPTLDLTSGMMAMAQRHQDGMGGLPAGESTSQYPRPPGVSAGGYDGGSNLRLRHTSSAPFNPTNTIPSYSGSNSSYYPDSSYGLTAVPLTPMEIQRMESGQLSQYQLIPDQDYLRQRADAMSQVEAQIVEVGTIFQKLAVMVNEHRDMVMRVEDNVEEANTNLNLSLAALTDTLQNLQTNRALLAKVMGIVVLFIIMFIIFFA